MSTELVAQNIGSADIAVAETSGTGYAVMCPLTGRNTTIDRDVDFGVIPGTKKPSLFKSGAEKIAMAFGLMQRFEVESAIENFEGKMPYCYYRVRCDLIKGFIQPNGEYRECVYATGHGSANTLEKRNGRNDVFNASNSTLKMAEKRALVSAVLAVSGLSSMFTMDMEDESTSEKAKAFLNENPDGVIGKEKLDRIFAIYGDNGITVSEAKERMAAMNMPKTSEIKNKDYKGIVKRIKEDIKSIDKIEEDKE